MLRFTVVTLFPELIEAFAAAGVLGRALSAGLARVDTVNPRDHSGNRHGHVDDSPYGGGPGMVMSVGPLRRAIAAARGTGDASVLFMSPQGRRIDQAAIDRFAGAQHLVLLAGRYEGIDERLIERDIDEEWSIGDFVLSGGEVAAMAIIDATVRRLPGALGNERSAVEDSFAAGLLDYPHYTRPPEIDGQPVPQVLLSGDHRAIAAWRRRQALLRTARRRPDLIRRAALEPAEREWLDDLDAQADGRDEPSHGAKG